MTIENTEAAAGRLKILGAADLSRLAGEWIAEYEMLGRVHETQQTLPPKALPFVFVRAVYIAYRFGRQHADRHSALRHAHDSLTCLAIALGDDGWADGCMSLVTELCNLFDSEVWPVDLAPAVSDAALVSARRSEVARQPAPERTPDYGRAVHDGAGGVRIVSDAPERAHDLGPQSAQEPRGCVDAGLSELTTAQAAPAQPDGSLSPPWSDDAASSQGRGSEGGAS